MRHLLTHTAGIREVLHPSGLLRMRDLGETVKLGRPVPSLAEYYRGGLRVDAEPGTRFSYTNHGFATLGQIVEDVSGMPLDRYFREHIFEPLGMERTDLIRSDGSSRASPRDTSCAPVEPSRSATMSWSRWVAAASTPPPRDMARYVAALLGGGANEHGSVLKPETLAAMFEPHYQPDPRDSGHRASGFFRHEIGGHLAVEHDGILPGFDSQILLAPDDGVGVMAFANGARRGMHWLAAGGRGPAEAGCSASPTRRSAATSRITPRSGASSVVGTGSPPCASDPAQVGYRSPGLRSSSGGGQLMIRALSPIPALYEGFVLHPTTIRTTRTSSGSSFPGSESALAASSSAEKPGGEATALHLEFAPLSFQKRTATDESPICGSPGRLARSRWPRRHRPFGGAAGDSEERIGMSVSTTTELWR